MAEKKHVDQQKVAEIRRVKGEQGDKAVDERYGSQARYSAEYAEAQRQAEAQEERDRERHRHEIEQSHERAAADRERWQRDQDRRDAEHDARLRDQQDREQHDREATVPDRADNRTPDAAPSADRSVDQAGQAEQEQTPEKPAPAREPDLADRLIAKQAAQREAREREGVTR